MQFFMLIGQIGVPRLDGFTIVCCVFIVAVAATTFAKEYQAYLIRKTEVTLQTRKAEMDADLKAGMIERGLSADEIERVLAATTDRNPPPADTSRLSKLKHFLAK